jgi:hypothetical protein
MLEHNSFRVLRPTAKLTVFPHQRRHVPWRRRNQRNSQGNSNVSSKSFPSDPCKSLANNCFKLFFICKIILIIISVEVLRDVSCDQTLLYLEPIKWKRDGDNNGGEEITELLKAPLANTSSKMGLSHTSDKLIEKQQLGKSRVHPNGHTSRGDGARGHGVNPPDKFILCL